MAKKRRTERQIAEQRMHDHYVRLFRKGKLSSDERENFEHVMRLEWKGRVRPLLPKKARKSKKIIIRLCVRGGSFEVSLGGSPKKWEAGRTEAEAIYKLILSNKKTFRIKVLNDERGR